MKFEATWKEGFDNFIRVFDETTNKSSEIKIPNNYEYYEVNSKGNYTYILDKNIHLQKCLGYYKNAKGKYGVRKPSEIYIRDNFWGHSYNLKPRIFYLDIETRSIGSFPTPELANQEITLIQVFDSFTKTMYVFGLRDYKPQEGYELEYSVKYVKCNSEVELLEKYFKFFKFLNPLIIFAWNGDGFDFPYLYNRLKNLGLDKNLLSNYGLAEIKEKMTKNGTIRILEASGHYYIDMLRAYKKFVSDKRSSFALDFIANFELGEGKVDHSEFKTFDAFYTGTDYQIFSEAFEDPVKEEIRQIKIKESNNLLTEEDNQRLKELLQFQFVYYGIKDVYLLKRLDDKINLSNIMLSIAQKTGCTLDDTLGTISAWNNYIANVCYTKNIALPVKTENDDAEITGGYVKDPERGLWKWVFSDDFNSMYPMNMVGFNMSPETYVPLAKAPSDLRSILMQNFYDQNEDRVLDLPKEIWDKTTELLKKYNYSMGINGAIFDNSEKGIIPELVWDIYTNRKADKKRMLNYSKQKEIIENILIKRKTT